MEIHLPRSPEVITRAARSPVIHTPWEVGRRILGAVNIFDAKSEHFDRLARESRIEKSRVYAQVDELEAKNMANIMADEVLQRVGRGEAVEEQVRSLRMRLQAMPPNITVQDIWLREDQLASLKPYIEDLLPPESD